MVAGRDPDRLRQRRQDRAPLGRGHGQGGGDPHVYRGVVWSVAFSPDGKRVAAACWSASGGGKTCEAETHGPPAPWCKGRLARRVLARASTPCRSRGLGPPATQTPVTGRAFAMA